MLWLAGLLACADGEDTGESSPEPGCADDEVREGSRCLPEACGVGVWGDLDVGAEGWAFVDGVAPNGGDGSLERPFRTLKEGLAASPRVYLAEGRYEAPPVISNWDEPRAIVGRCQQLVTLVGGGNAGISWEGWEQELTLSDLTLQDTAGVFTALAPLALRDLRFVDTLRTAVWAANQGTATLERVVIEGVAPSDAGIGGWAVLVEGEGVVTATDLTLAGYGSAGVLVQDRGTFVGERLVLGPGTGESPELVAGLAVQGVGSTARCTDCLMDGVLGASALARAGGHLELLDSRVTWPQPVDGFAAGVVVDEATAWLDGVLVEDVPGYGVIARGGGELLFEDLTVRRVQLDSQVVAVAVGAFEDSDLDGQGLWVEDTVGIALWGDGFSGLDLTDVTVLGVRGAQGGLAPAVLSNVGVVELTDFLISDSAGQAVVAQDAGLVWLTEGTIDATTPVAGQALDLGVLEYSQIRAFDLTLAGPWSHGAAVGEGGNLYIEGGLLEPSDGVGVFVQEGGQGGLIDVEVQGRVGAGVGATGSGAVLHVRSSVVRGTLRRDDLKLASAFSASAGATVDLDRVEALDTQGYGLVSEQYRDLHCTDCLVDGAVLAGAFVANEGSMTLERVVLRGVQPEPSSGLSMGVFAGSVDELGASLTLNEVTVEPAGHAALWVEGARVQATDCRFEGGPRVELLPGVWAYGHAVYAAGSDPSLVDSELVGADGAGLFLHGAGASLSGVLFQDNAVDLHQQACVGEPLSPPQGASSTLCPEYDEPTLPMSFYGVVDLGGL